MKICKSCKSKFIPTRPFQVVCSIKCAHDYSKILQAKKKNKAKIEFRKSDKTYLTRQAQYWVNKYVRLRDKGVCISCGNSTRKMDAGHYRPQGRNSALRFDEKNIHCQCVLCNQYKSGNLVAYRKNLIIKIGLKAVEELEGNNLPKKWSAEELRGIISEYKLKVRNLNEKEL
jgi:hypothetical protein